MDSADKVRENRLRRMAARRGYTLSKSRRRDGLAPDYGKWTLADNLRRASTRHGLSLDEVEEHLGKGRDL